MLRLLADPTPPPPIQCSGSHRCYWGNNRGEPIHVRPRNRRRVDMTASVVTQISHIARYDLSDMTSPGPIFVQPRLRKGRPSQTDRGARKTRYD